MCNYETIHRCKDCPYETGVEADIVKHCKIPKDRRGPDGIAVKKEGQQIIEYHLWYKGKKLNQGHNIVYEPFFKIDNLEIEKNKNPEQGFKKDSNYGSASELRELKEYLKEIGMKTLPKKELQTLKEFLLKTDYKNLDSIKNLETI